MYLEFSNFVWFIKDDVTLFMPFTGKSSKRHCHHIDNFKLNYELCNIVILMHFVYAHPLILDTSC